MRTGLKTFLVMVGDYWPCIQQPFSRTSFVVFSNIFKFDCKTTSDWLNHTVYPIRSCVIFKCLPVILTLSAPWAESWSFADGIDQDQTAQNVQSDLDLRRPLVESDICGTIICGTLWILFTVVERFQL